MELKSNLPNADMQAAPRALLRAALRAREIAYRTGTPLVIMRDGKVVEEMVTEKDLEAFRREIETLLDRADDEVRSR